jgi:aryl-alcohol dehydrogenase-like predicted oxidoreductase
LSVSQRSNTQTALQFVLKHPAIVSAVAGIRTLQHLEEAVKTIHTVPLTGAVSDLLSHVIPLNYYTEHR